MEEIEKRRRIEKMGDFEDSLKFYKKFFPDVINGIYLIDLGEVEKLNSFFKKNTIIKEKPLREITKRTDLINAVKASFSDSIMGLIYYENKNNINFYTKNVDIILSHNFTRKQK